jgi:hypothetical protein
MARGPEAFADAGEKSHDPGQDLVLAIKKKKRFSDGGARIQKRKEFFKKTGHRKQGPMAVPVRVLD